MDYKILVNKQKDFFQSGSTKNYSFRICQLKTLKSNIIKHQDDILNSLYADLGKSNSESYLTEVGLVLKEISFHIKHLKNLSDKGVKISIDLVTENTNRYNEVVVPALKYVDNIIINELEASYLSKVKIVDELNEVNIDKLKEAAKVIKDSGVKDLVIIHAPLVSLLYDGFKFTVLTSLKLPEGFIKSSVGAGDGFCAGALFGIIKGLPPKEILEIASSLAAAVLNSETSHSEIKGLKNILRLEKLYGRYK